MNPESSEKFDDRSVPLLNPKQKQRLNEYFLISLFAMTRDFNRKNVLVKY